MPTGPRPPLVDLGQSNSPRRALVSAEVPEAGRIRAVSEEIAPTTSYSRPNARGRTAGRVEVGCRRQPVHLLGDTHPWPVRVSKNQDTTLLTGTGMQPRGSP